jgi:hypothetical protein
MGHELAADQWNQEERRSEDRRSDRQSYARVIQTPP